MNRSEAATSGKHREGLQEVLEAEREKELDKQKYAASCSDADVLAQRPYNFCGRKSLPNIFRDVLFATPPLLATLFLLICFLTVTVPARFRHECARVSLVYQPVVVMLQFAPNENEEILSDF